MKLNVFTRVFGLLTNSFSPPPAEENFAAEPTEEATFGPNMRRAMIRARNKQPAPTSKHPGVAIAEARAQQLRDKTAAS